MDNIEKIDLAPGYQIPRIINGGYQWKDISRADVMALALAQADAGLLAFETADTYPGGEDLLGEVQARRRRDGTPPIRIHTRYTPDITDRVPSSREVEMMLDDALIRLRSDHVDLLQLQWWQLERPGWLDVYGWLTELCHTGKIAHVGLSNFTLDALKSIVGSGLPVASNQVQISLIDQRALGEMGDFCLAHDIALLGYGPLCGGYLARPMQDPKSQAADYSKEYRLMVDLSGGWDLLQDLVSVLLDIAERHHVDASTVALRWALDQAGVSALLLGASSPGNIDRNLAAFDLKLTPEDEQAIKGVLDQMKPPSGGPGELERDPYGAFRKMIEESARSLSNEPADRTG